VKPPIIIDEQGDISIYRTIVDAELALEAIDVKAERYKAYDSVGLSLQLAILNEPKKAMFGLFDINTEIVRIQPRNESLLCDTELATKLREFLRRTELPETERKSIDNLQLDELIVLYVKELGYTR
jgi:hypothetical protein